jgi:glutathione S-transferase
MFMKLHDSIGPNPRLVRMFIAEKGLDIPRVTVDLMRGENRQDAYKAKNPTGQTPCLELDDGSFLSETVVICEYLEELYPKPALIGTSAAERAQARLWTRRAEYQVTIPMADGFRFAEGLQLFKSRIHTIPQAADDLKAIARKGLAWLDGELAKRSYLCGERYTLADIRLFAFLEFGKTVGQAPDPKLQSLAAWYERVAARPATQASK